MARRGETHVLTLVDHLVLKEGSNMTNVRPIDQCEITVCDQDVTCMCMFNKRKKFLVSCLYFVGFVVVLVVVILIHDDDCRSIDS